MDIIYLLNIIFISRLVVYLGSTKDNLKKVIVKSLIQLAGLTLIYPDTNLFIFAVILIIINISFLYLSNKVKNSSVMRMIELTTVFIILIVFADPAIGLRLNYYLINEAAGIYPISLTGFTPGADWVKINLFVFGLLFLMLESSLIIKLILDKFNIGTEEAHGEEDDTQVDEKLEGAGKLIGILERIFIYILVLLGEYSAIGLIIAAKSFARFKELDERNFAEYVLIGTLLSALTAFVVSLIIVNQI